MSQFRECGKRTSEKPSPKTFGLGFTLQFNGWVMVFKHQVSLKFCDRQCKLKFVSFKLINMKKFNQNHVVPKIRDKKKDREKTQRYRTSYRKKTVGLVQLFVNQNLSFFPSFLCQNPE